MELKKLNNMYTVELLNESKFAKPVILNWFKQQMLNSFQGTELTKEQIDYLVENGCMPDENKDNLESMSLTSLKEMAKEKGISFIDAIAMLPEEDFK